jgi:hypothetical protein
MSEELKTRTKAFAHRFVKLAMAMPNTKLGHHMLREAGELTAIFITSRKTANKDE